MTETAPTPPSSFTRKQLIINATLQTIVEEGVAGLGLRHVAKEAGVALGSISYYFTDKDGLLSAAFQDYTARSVAEFSAFYRDVHTLADARQATVSMLCSTAASRTDLILSAELYSLSLRRPRHRMVLSQWTQSCRDVMARYFDSDATLALDALWEGLVLHTAMKIDNYDPTFIARTVERLTPEASFIYSATS